MPLDGAPNPANQLPAAKRSDEAEAVRFLLIKGAIFILVPLVAAALAVVFLMPN
jgi:hypothetical protein